jgi:hypothetical protein
MRNRRSLIIALIIGLLLVLLARHLYNTNADFRTSVDTAWNSITRTNQATPSTVGQPTYLPTMQAQSAPIPTQQVVPVSEVRWNVFVVYNKGQNLATTTEVDPADDRRAVREALGTWTATTDFPNTIWLEVPQLALLNQSGWNGITFEIWHGGSLDRQRMTLAQLAALPVDSSFVAVATDVSWTNDFAQYVNTRNGVYTSTMSPVSQEFTPFFRHCMLDCVAIFSRSVNWNSLELAPRAPGGWFNVYGNSCSETIGSGVNYSNASECGRESANNVLAPAQPAGEPTPSVFMAQAAPIFSRVVIEGANQNSTTIVAVGYSIGSTELTEVTEAKCQQGCTIYASQTGNLLNSWPEGVTPPSNVFVSHLQPLAQFNNTCQVTNTFPWNTVTNAIVDLSASCLTPQ